MAGEMDYVRFLEACLDRRLCSFDSDQQSRLLEEFANTRCLLFCVLQWADRRCSYL